MPNNFDGLGIGFTAEDDGAVEVVKTLGTSVDDLWEGLKRVGSAVPKMGVGIVRGLGRISAASSRTVGIIGAGIGSLVEKAMSPELDSAYASMYAGFNKEFSAMTAGMKDTEGRLEEARSRIGGIAQGMGEDMNGASKAWIAFEKQGVKLDEVLGTKGLSGTIRRLIKVTSVYGVEGEQLASIAGALKKGFGFTEQQIGTMADEMVYLGREFNMGKEVIQGWQGSLESANKDLADFGKSATPENIRKYMLDMAKLGVVYHEALGIQAPQALEAARESFAVFMSERKNIQQMARGMGGEFGPLLKGLLEAGENSDEVFRRITEGDPIKFLEMMSKVASQAEKMGGETGIAFQRLKGVIADAMGPDATYLVTGNLDEIRSRLDEVSGTLEKSKGAFADIAESHWKSSVTAGEAWDMMVNNMRAKVFTLSNKEIGKWKKNMASGFKESFQVIEAMAKDDGPLGQLTTRLLAVQRVGLSALLPGLGSMGPILQGIATDALPMLTALGSMGVRFSDLGKLAGVGGAGYLFFKVMSEGPEHVIGQFTKMSDSLLDIAENKLFKGDKYIGVRKWIKGFRREIGDLGLFGALESQFSKIDWGGLWDAAIGKASDVIKFVSGILGKVPWEDVARTVFSAIGDAVRAMGSAIWSVLFGGEDSAVDGAKSSLEKVLVEAFVGAFKTIGRMARGAAKGLWDSVFDPSSAKESISNILKLATGAFASLMVLSKRFRGAVFKQVGSAVFGSVKKGVSSGMSGGSMMDIYGGGLAHLIPGFGGDVMGKKRSQKPPPIPSKSRIGRIQRISATEAYQREIASMGGLSGGVYAPHMMTPGLGRGDGRAMGRIFNDRRMNTMGRAADRVKGSLTGVLKSAKGLGTKGVQSIKNFSGAISGLGKMVAPIALINGAMEGFNQISERSKNIAEINAADFLSSNEKTALEAEATFVSVAETIDSLFMGLPSTIGDALGISTDDLKSFYHFMVGSIESGINTSVKLFMWLKDSVVAIFDRMSAHTERVIAEIVHGFQSAKSGIVEIFYNVSDSIEDLFSGMTSTLMYPFEWLSHKLRGWMGDLIESIFGKFGEWGARQEFLSSIPGLDADLVKGIQKMGSDAIEMQKKELMGYATFEEAYGANQKKAQKRRDDDRAKRNKDLLTERQAADDILKSVYEGTQGAIDRGTSEAIMGTLDSTLAEVSKDHDQIMDWTHRQEEAARYGEERMRREEMRAGKLEQDENDKENEKRRSGNRAPRKEAPGPKERGESEVTDLGAYFRDAREFSKKEREDLIKAVAESPIDAHLTVKLDGKTIARTTERVRRERAAGTGL